MGGSAALVICALAAATAIRTSLPVVPGAAVPPVHASDSASADAVALQRRTLDAAVLLTGQDLRNLPIVLVSDLREGASRGAEGWTTFDEYGRPDHIAIYTGSEVFLCANKRFNASYQCQLKLASVLVHEVWHLRNGHGEAGAYAAQIAFLIGRNAPGVLVTGVRRARARALEVEARRRTPALLAARAEE